MQPTFANQLDALAAWRRGLERRALDLARHIKDNDLDVDDESAVALKALANRLQGDRLSVAFVAEFSRGKSELINAIFFADTGHRVLPATPGRTTMCPVEIGFDAAEPPQLALLPIETRLDEMTLADWRNRPERWKRIRLDAQSSSNLTEGLSEVMRTKAVTVARARDLGLWHEDRPEDNPPMMADGLVEVPAWRHAAINYPHPLLRRGLVVLDTPGLNAIGTEPELTLSLLPSAHAVVFILGADTGVTKSDLAVWRDHLNGPGMKRYVALNKIDTLVDPLLSPEAVQLQIESQRQSTAQQLGIDAAHVFPVSARQALTGRVEGKPELLKASRILDLESALTTDLLPRRHEALANAVDTVAKDIERRTDRKIQDMRRQLTEQLLELRGLRGKSSGKTTMMVNRVKEEAQEFEKGAARVTAVRSIHVRMLRVQLAALSSNALREEFEVMAKATQSTMFNLGAKKAFSAMFERLRVRMQTAYHHGCEAHEMLGASFKQLNAEFGFALTLNNPPDLLACAQEMAQLEANYSQYLGVSSALRMGDKRFLEQFLRMLLAKLRVAFEGASSDIEQWHKSASSQLESQLRDRQTSYARRQETLERIVGAQDELETRIAEIEGQDRRWQTLAQQTVGAAQDLRRSAANKPRELDAALATAAPFPSVIAKAPSEDVTRPMLFDVRPQVPTGFHADSHTQAVHVNTTRAPELAA